MKKKLLWIPLFSAVMILGFVLSADSAGEKSDSNNVSIRAVALDLCEKALVKVEVDKIGGGTLWYGSGVLYTPTRIITNSHVVGELPQDPEKFRKVYSDSDLSHLLFWVTFQGKRYHASFIGRDPEIDLAIIEIQQPLPFGVPALLGDSDVVKIGEAVLACGNPMGSDNSITSGIISQKEKKNGLIAYEDYLQTDAAVNGGNSGGPLVSLETGKVIGIVNSKIPFSDNMGYAIPINIFKAIEKELRGTVRRSWIGVRFPLIDFKDTEGFRGLLSLYNLTGVNSIETLSNMKKEIFDDGGVLITDVMRAFEIPTFDFHSGSNELDLELGPLTNLKPPAYKSGLIIGDIIKKFGNMNVKNSRDLTRAIFFSKPFKKIPIEIVRFTKQGTRVQMTVELIPLIRPPENARGEYY